MCSNHAGCRLRTRAGRRAIQWAKSLTQNLAGAFKVPTKFDMPQEFHVFGVVHPEWSAAELKFPKFGLKGSVEGEAFISIHGAQVLLTVWATSVNLKDKELNSCFQGLLGHFVYALGFQLGYAYEVEVSAIVIQADAGQASHTYCGVEYPPAAKPSEIRLPWEILFSAIRHEKAIFLTRAMRDLASAVRTVGDSAFYCYRALESVRQFFGQTKGVGKEKKDVWPIVWSELGVDSALSFKIRDAAEEVRHGGVGKVEIRDHERWIEYACLVVTEFARYLAKRVEAKVP